MSAFRLFFGRIHDTLICFQDLVTFRSLEVNIAITRKDWRVSMQF